MGRKAITRAILFSISLALRVCLCNGNIQNVLLLFCWDGPISEMACDEEESNENHEDTERSAQNLHESVKGDAGMREINGVI